MAEAPETRTLRIEYVPLDEILRWERNPKEHDMPGLLAAFERFGFVAPMGRNDATGKLLWGHGRLDALLELREAGKPATPRHPGQEGGMVRPGGGGHQLAAWRR